MHNVINTVEEPNSCTHFLDLPGSILPALIHPWGRRHPRTSTPKSWQIRSTEGRWARYVIGSGRTTAPTCNDHLGVDDDTLRTRASPGGDWCRTQQERIGVARNRHGGANAPRRRCAVACEGILRPALRPIAEDGSVLQQQCLWRAGAAGGRPTRHAHLAVQSWALSNWLGPRCCYDRNSHGAAHKETQ